MNSICAIFTKQLNDLPKNVAVSLLYVLFPAMAFIMGNMIGDMDIYASMFAAMFVGVTPMIAICNTVAEDREYKSLRFLVVAGVKPSQYLSGLAGFVILMSLFPLAFFIAIGGFSGIHLVKFAIIALLGLIASAVLGAIIGIFSKNVQQAAAIYTPFMMLIAFMPMLASVNETLAVFAELIFSHQVFLIAIHQEADLTRALLVILANIAVLLAFFIFAYKKKGLRD
jgi:ABC-2 type transport system permease protein